MRLFDEYGKEIYLYKIVDGCYDSYSGSTYHSYVKITQEMSNQAQIEYDKYVKHLHDSRNLIMEKYKPNQILPKIGKKERKKLEEKNLELLQSKTALLKDIPHPISWQQFVVDFFDLKHIEAEFEF